MILMIFMVEWGIDDKEGKIDDKPERIDDKPLEIDDKISLSMKSRHCFCDGFSIFYEIKSTYAISYKEFIID